MPYLDINDTRLYYEDHRPAPSQSTRRTQSASAQGAVTVAQKSEVTKGSKAKGAKTPEPETLLFSHGLLWDMHIYDAQILELSGQYRCIAYDHRGQGQSEVPAVDVIDMETCYSDAAVLIESLGVGPCHFVGLSMGGFVGLRLAARRPDLVKSLILMDTAADAEPRENRPKYRMLNAVARYLSVKLVVDRLMPIMFGASTLADPGRQDEVNRWRQWVSKNQRSIYKAVNGVIYRPSVEAELAAIKCPVLILHGEEDAAIRMRRAEAMSEKVPQAELIRLPKTGHMSSLEAPGQVTQAMREFLAKHVSSSTKEV